MSKVCKVRRACDVKVGDILANLGKVITSEEYANGWEIVVERGGLHLFYSKTEHLILSE